MREKFMVTSREQKKNTHIKICRFFSLLSLLLQVCTCICSVYSSTQHTCESSFSHLQPIYTILCVSVCDEWIANRLIRNGMCVVCCILLFCALQHVRYCLLDCWLTCSWVLWLAHTLWCWGILSPLPLLPL